MSKKPDLRVDYSRIRLPVQPCFLYLFTHYEVDDVPCAPVKIGITTSIEARLKTISTASSKKVGLFFSFGFPAKQYAQMVERALHRQLGGLRLNGEWFEIEPFMAMLEATIMVADFYRQNLGHRPDMLRQARDESGWADAEAILRDVANRLPRPGAVQ